MSGLTQAQVRTHAQKYFMKLKARQRCSDPLRPKDSGTTDTSLVSGAKGEADVDAVLSDVADEVDEDEMEGAGTSQARSQQGDD